MYITGSEIQSYFSSTHVMHKLSELRSYIFLAIKRPHGVRVFSISLNIKYRVMNSIFLSYALSLTYRCPFRYMLLFEWALCTLFSKQICFSYLGYVLKPLLDLMWVNIHEVQSILVYNNVNGAESSDELFWSHFV